MAYHSSEVASRLPEGMAGLAKGLVILEAFADSGGRMTVADAARVSGASRASARRCLLTLTELGYLGYDGKFFRPQPRILSLARAYNDTASLPRVAQPFLIDARDELGQSISLAIMDHDVALFVARAESERLVSSRIAIGAREQAYCSATGRVLLAALPDEQVGAYLERTDIVARTKHSVVDKAKLLGIVREVREQEHAISDEELEIGLRSIAVPVLDQKRNVLAAMSASGASTSVTRAMLVKKLLPPLQKHAARLGRVL